MTKGRKYMSHYPENPPKWYWTNGLHDACITGSEAFEFPFDYNRFVGNKNKYDRNLLTLIIDAKNALYDISVKEIRFFNYKILTQDISLENKENMWWLYDSLTTDGASFILEIGLMDVDSFPEEFILKIKFDRAEVERI